MNIQRILPLALLALALLFPACTPQPAPNQPFGSSVRMALDNQKVNPGPVDDTPPSDLDGTYAAGLMRTYQSPDRFKSGTKTGGASSSPAASSGSSSSPSSPTSSGSTGQTSQPPSLLQSTGSSPTK